MLDTSCYSIGVVFMQAPPMLMQGAQEKNISESVFFLCVAVPGSSVNIGGPWATIISCEVCDLSTLQGRQRTIMTQQTRTCFKLILSRVVRFLCVHFYDWTLSHSADQDISLMPFAFGLGFNKNYC